MDIQTRRLVISLPVAVLLSAPLITAAAAASSAHASLSPRSLPTWAHGSITGAGPHSGVRLVLVAWPNPSAMAKIRVGQTKRLQVIGKATSTGTGTYAIHSSVALPKGIHNLEVLARSSVAVGAFSFARNVGRAGALVSVDGTAAAGPVTANIRMRALPRSAVPTVPDPGICLAIIKKTRELGKRWVTVAGLYSTEFPASMKLTYSAGSNTTLGVGVGISGENGSFEAGGTFTETNASTVLFPGETDETGRTMQTSTPGAYTVFLAVSCPK